MYKISFCRRSKYCTPNKKGVFVKEFKTLDEIVKFYIKTNNNLWCPKIKEELTKREFVIFLNKLNSQITLNNIAE